MASFGMCQDYYFGPDWRFKISATRIVIKVLSREVGQISWTVADVSMVTLYFQPVILV